MGRLIFPITKKEAEKSGVAYSSQANKDALFPSRLRELREEKGVSQAILSTTLGVSKSTVGLWETGDTLPDAKALYDMAEYFGVSADYMLGIKDYKSTDADERQALEYTGLSEDALHALIRLREMDDEISQYMDSISKFLSTPNLPKILLYFSMAKSHSQNVQRSIAAIEAFEVSCGGYAKVLKVLTEHDRIDPTEVSEELKRVHDAYDDLKNGISELSHCMEFFEFALYRLNREIQSTIEINVELNEIQDWLFQHRDVSNNIKVPDVLSEVAARMRESK